MNRIKELAVEEMALEGARGISWKTLEEMVRSRQEASLLVRTIRPDFELIREELVSEGIISHVRGDVYELSGEQLRFRALGISHLPVIYENGQSLRILEMVARGRQRGAWSFAICTALRVDAKQLFHLSNVLVEFGLILRFSSAPIPRHLKSHSSGTNASFFILSRYSSTNMMDPDIADVVDPSHSTENVCSLILALVREAGGLILSKVLRSAVVINGGFTNKQYRRGLARLSSNRRVELVWVPGDEEDDQEENDEDENEDEEKGDLKFSSKNGLYAIKLVSVSSNDLHQAEEKEVDPSPHAVQPSEEGGLVKEEQDSSEEEIVQGGEEDLNNYMRLRNFLRSNLSYKESLVSIIEASGASGVTTREISLLTGVGPKEILKTMESVRANDLVETVWRNDGKKKFIVYKSKKNDLTINVDDIISSVAGSTPPPTTLSSGRGYVTDQTMRRSVLAAEILGSRGALSLIDLGRAIEALELSQGIGIPGAQIDRRTLKKICEISSIPLVEKGESSQTKIIIAYDPAQMTPAEACTRVDRPVGITPKAGSKIKTPPSAAPPLLQKNSSLYKKISVSELTSKSRLAHLAVFGKSAESSPVVSFKVAELYGLVRGAEIFKAKQMHHFLLSRFALEPPFLASLSDIIAELPLLLYLQCIGCGVAHAFIDEFFSSKNFQDLPIRLLPENVVQHLTKCVPAPANVTKTSQNASLAKVLAPLVKLNLIKIVKNGDKADLRYLIERDAVIITPSMDSSSEEVSARVSFMENGQIVYPAIEEYWSNLLRVCMHWRRSAGTGVVAKNYLSLPQVFRRQQWRCKVVVTLGQRRELEALLKKLLREGDSPSRPVVVDGSNEELVKVCARNNMDPITALKALRQLHALFQDGNNGNSSSLVFANVNQARFSCPHCGQLFFQLSSIQRHFQVAHSISAPSDISEFTREEYMHALERARPSSTSVAGQKKRRRRRNNKGISTAAVKQEEVEDDHQRDFVSSTDASEGALYMKAFSLARSLLNSGGGTILVPSDPSLIDPSHLVWELTHRIMNDVEGSLFTAGAAELTRMACLKKSSSFPPPTTSNKSVGVAVDDSRKTTTLASCLVLNKLLEADVGYVESVCKNNGVELSQVTALMANWHQNGVLAIERHHAKHHGGYTLSRSGRVCMFGKHSQVAKLCLIIENLIACSDFLSIEEEPPCSNQQDISSVVVACMLDRMQPESLFFDISENNILFAENVTIEQEDQDEEENDGFTGIKKHLDLSQQLAGTIARVELHQELVTTPVVGKIEKFLRELIRLSRSRKSHVWRPCPAEETEDEFPGANIVFSLLPDENNPLLRDRLAKKIDCVYVPAAVGNNNNPPSTVPGFVSMVFDISKNFHALFAPLTDFPKIIAPWTDIDGDIKEQLLADLLLNVLLLVYAFPGISVCAIKPHLVILTSQEIHWLVDIWIQLGLVEAENDGLFLKSVPQWGGSESSS